MNSLQPTDGRTSRRTNILLTLLITVSLLGALAVQWSSLYNGDASRTVLITGSESGSGPIKQGLVASATPSLERNIVHSRDYGLWSYVATRGTTGLNVDLSYRFSTVSGLNEYVTMNRERAAELIRAGGEVDVLVTFRWLLTPAEFRKWATDCGIDVAQTSLRLSADGGVAGTLTVSGQKDDPLPEAALERGQKKLPPVEGVYSVRGKAPSSMLEALMSEPQVFVADVTPTLSRLDLIEVGVPGAQDATINCESPYDMLEKFEVRN